MMIKTVLNEGKWLKQILLRKAKSRLMWPHRFARYRASPTPPNGPILLHLGCGEIDAAGFTNIDTKPAPHVHYVQDVTDLSLFPDKHASLVYACHVLEHIPASQTKATLWEWSRVLKSGGHLRLSVPDLDALFTMYTKEGRAIDSIALPLMGHDDGYSPHVAIFNYMHLEAMLTELGLIDVHRWNPDTVTHHDFEDWASRLVNYQGHDYHISLNIEATKA